MVKYELRIEKQKIFGAEKIAIAADANATVSLRFYFDSNWRVFDAKAAIFRTAENKYYIIEIKGSSVTVPWEVLTVENDFELSVIGYDGAAVLTAGKVDIRVVSSLLPEDCKTFSPSETLFDRFKQDSIAEAFKKYEDELENQKRSCDEKLVEMGTQIDKANGNTKAVEKAKNEEIEKIRQEHSAEIVRLNAEMNELKTKYAAAKNKADNWDLVDEAMSNKTVNSNAPWAGGTKQYKLPFFNTKSMKTFTNNNFDNYLTEIGLDLSSAGSMAQIFKEKGSLRKIELRNTNGVTSLLQTFMNSKSLREVILDDIMHCTTLKSTFFGCTSLERVVIGKNERIIDYTDAFNGCIALRDIIGELNMVGTNYVESTFLGCARLRTVAITKDSLYKSISFGPCVELSKESMESIIAGLKQGNNLSVCFSGYAFENNYPTSGERLKVRDILKQKGWTLSLS